MLPAQPADKVGYWQKPLRQRPAPQQSAEPVQCPPTGWHAPVSHTPLLLQVARPQQSPLLEQCPPEIAQVASPLHLPPLQISP